MRGRAAGGNMPGRWRLGPQKVFASSRGVNPAGDPVAAVRQAADFVQSGSGGPPGRRRDARPKPWRLRLPEKAQSLGGFGYRSRTKALAASATGGGPKPWRLRLPGAGPKPWRLRLPGAGPKPWRLRLPEEAQSLGGFGYRGRTKASTACRYRRAARTAAASDARPIPPSTNAHVRHWLDRVSIAWYP